MSAAEVPAVVENSFAGGTRCSYLCLLRSCSVVSLRRCTLRVSFVNESCLDLEAFAGLTPKLPEDRMVMLPSHAAGHVFRFPLTR
jgi:hypothetical protein